MSDINTRKTIPIARYWRLHFLGPFTKGNGETCDGCMHDVSFLQYGAVIMQSGDTNVRMRKEMLPKVRVDSPLVAVRRTGAQLAELVNAKSTDGDWWYNDTTRIGKTSAHGIHYDFDYLSNETKGGLLEYEFKDPTRVNEIILVNTLAAGEISHVPDKLVINYSVDGINWSTEKAYVFGVDWNVRFVAPNPDGIHASAIVLKRSRSTNMWADAILLENMRGSVGEGGYMSDEYGERAYANAYNKPQFKCADFRSSVHPSSISVSDMCESVSQISDGYPRDSLKATLHASTYLSNDFTKMNYGFSYYAAVWAPVSSPFTHTNINLPFSFIHSSAKTACKTQQVLEAGPRYLHAHKFKHGGFPKLMMSMTNDCYQSEINSLGFRYSEERGACDNVLFNRLNDNDLSIVQFSNKILLPPDGLPFGGAPNGELLGTAFMSLPLTGSSADPVNHWTLFINTKNFKGPLAYFMPEKLRDGLDRNMMQSELHFGMQIESLPSTVEGDYAKIPSIKFPLLKGKGLTELVKDVFNYSNDGLYKNVRAIRDDLKRTGNTNKSKIDPFFMSKDTHGFKTTLFTSPTEFTFGDVRVTGVEPNIAEKVPMNNVGLFYKWDSLKQVDDVSGSMQQATFPEYMHRWAHDAWRPIDDFQLQSSSQYGVLKAHTFDIDGDEGGIYTVLNDQGRLSGAWASPGPAQDIDGKIGPYDVLLADGSTVVYYWYRFVDQPAFKQIRGSKSTQEWNDLQNLVTVLHTSWRPDLNYIPNPTSGKLVEMDPGLIVCPPRGLEHGYVPIVVAQYRRARAHRTPGACTEITHVKSGLGIPNSVSGVLRCGSETYATVPDSQECSITDYMLTELNTADMMLGIRPSTGNRICKYIGKTKSYRDRLTAMQLANMHRVLHIVKTQQNNPQKDILIQYNDRFERLNSSIIDKVLELEELDVSISNIQRSITIDANFSKLNAVYAQGVVAVKNAELQKFVDVSRKITEAIESGSYDKTSLGNDFATMTTIVDRLTSIHTTAESLLTKFNDFFIKSLRDQLDTQIINSPKLEGVKKRMKDINASILIGDDIKAVKKKVDDYNDAFATTLDLTNNRGYKNHLSDIEIKLYEFETVGQRIRDNLEKVNNNINNINNIKRDIGTYSDTASLKRVNSEVQRIVDEDITIAENVINLDIKTILSIISHISNSEKVIMNHIRTRFLIKSNIIIASFESKKLGLQKGLDAVPTQLEEMDDIRKQFQYIVDVLRQVYSDLTQNIVNNKQEVKSIWDDAKTEFSTLAKSLSGLIVLRESFTENSMDVFASFIQSMETIQTSISGIEQKLERIIVLKGNMLNSLLSMSRTYYMKMNDDVHGISIFHRNALVSIRMFRVDIINKNDNIWVNVGFNVDRIDKRYVSYFNYLDSKVDEKRNKYALLKAKFVSSEKTFNDTISTLIDKAKSKFPVRNVSKYPVRSDFDLFVSVYDDMYVDKNGGKAMFDRIMSMDVNEFENGEFGKEVIDNMRNFITTYENKKVRWRKSTTQTTSAHKQIDLFIPSIPSNKTLVIYNAYNNHFVNFHNNFDSRLKISMDMEVPFILKELDIQVTQIRPKDLSSNSNAWFDLRIKGGYMFLNLSDSRLSNGWIFANFRIDDNGRPVYPSMHIPANTAIGNLTGRIHMEFEYNKKEGFLHKIVSGGKTYRFANMTYRDDEDKIRWMNPNLYKIYINNFIPLHYSRRGDDLLFEHSTYQVTSSQNNVKLHNIDVSQFSFDLYVCPPEPCKGSWSTWSACPKECGGGEQTKTFTVTRLQKHGGGCEALHNETKRRLCNTGPCPTPTSNDVGVMTPPILKNKIMQRAREYILNMRPTNITNIRFYLSADVELPDGMTLGGHRSHVIHFTQRRVEGLYPQKGVHFQIYDGGIMFQYYDKDFNLNRNGIIEINQLPRGYFSLRDVPELTAMSGRIRIQLMITESHDFMVKFNDYRIDQSNSKTAHFHGSQTIELYREKMSDYPRLTYSKISTMSYANLKLHSIYAEHFVK